jgi:hypothetical protein
LFFINNNINTSHESQASEHNTNDRILCDVNLQARELMDSLRDLAETTGTMLAELLAIELVETKTTSSPKYSTIETFLPRLSNLQHSTVVTTD